MESDLATPRNRVYAPARNLMLYVTEDCNLRCHYCFVRKEARRMTVETARKAVDFFFNRAITGAEQEINITFFGGEPFLELDLLEEVVRYARQPRPHNAKRMRFAATTNATVATDRVERLVRESGMSLLVSMDGGQEAALHRPFVSGRSSYGAVARNLRRFASWSDDVMVRMTFHPDSLDLLGNARHALELGAPAVALCPVLEVSWSGFEERLVSAYDELGDWYVSEVRAGRVPGLSVTNTLLKQLHRHRRFGEYPVKPCGVGSSMLGVDTSGNVMPCHRFLYRQDDWLGTVDRPSLNARHGQYKTLFSRDMVDCSGCPAATVCGGGCRAVAVNAGLSLHQAHPNHCLTMRVHAAIVNRIYDTLMAEPTMHFTRMLQSANPSSSIAELAFR